MKYEVRSTEYGVGIADEIRHFSDLRTWQKSHAFVVGIYRLTADFPVEERFGLTSQMRRAAVSVTSNIAEAFNRVGIKDKANFFVMSQGSVSELQDQLLIARDLRYIEDDSHDKYAEASYDIHKMLTGLIKSTKGRPS